MSAGLELKRLWHGTAAKSDTCCSYTRDRLPCTKGHRVQLMLGAQHSYMGRHTWHVIGCCGAALTCCPDTATLGRHTEARRVTGCHACRGTGRSSNRVPNIATWAGTHGMSAAAVQQHGTGRSSYTLLRHSHMAGHTDGYIHHRLPRNKACTGRRSHGLLCEEFIQHSSASKGSARGLNWVQRVPAAVPRS